jgi:hypothetical protein
MSETGMVDYSWYIELVLALQPCIVNACGISELENTVSFK